MKIASRLLCLLLVLPLMLTACVETKTTKSRPKAEKRYSADEYVKNVSLGRMALAADPASVPNANIDVVKAYHAQRKAASERRVIVVIDYIPQGSKKRQQVLASIPAPPSNNDLPTLVEVMTALGRTPNTLNDIHLMTATLAPVKNVKIASADAAQAAATLDGQQQHIMTRAQPLAPLSNVQAQLQLIDFFTQNRFRDAAYLSLDNAKRALAAAAEKKSIPAETLQQLSQRLEVLEGELHQALPFTL